jgi:hypothetical protein
MCFETHLSSERRGSLLIRNLNELVKPQHFVLNSEFLVTLLVVVPKYVLLFVAVLCIVVLVLISKCGMCGVSVFCRHMYKDWLQSYVTITDFVVPHSSE